MLLSSWLAPLRNGLVRSLGRRNRTRYFRRSDHGTTARTARLVEHLEDRVLLTAPTLADIEPNVGAFITQGTVLSESPQELTFKFSPGQTINEVTNPVTGVTTVPGISISRAAATATTDFGTNGSGVLELD